MSKSMEAGKPPSLNSLKEKKTLHKGRPHPHAALAIQVMIESPWNFNYLIRTIWFFNVAKWRISMFHNKITVLIYISTHGHQFSSIFRYVKSPFGACQSCYTSALVTLGFLAPSCKEPGLLEPPWGSGASSAAWGKPVLLLWGCSLQWELPGICLFRFTIAKMRHILLGGCATPLKHMSQLELFFPIKSNKWEKN